ncbi:MAG: phosphopantothenoylcysteine decarboxylase [Planctomycetota bacterium]|jgi:phosphopantothenoylcysteine decarboxylase/phosphopantothenate--cysteine ligase
MRVLVTAGPTREHLDDIRFLSNASTGRMGFAIARAAVEKGHDVTLVCGPTPERPPEGPDTVRVTSALEMRDAALAAFPETEAVFMTAAVGDYRPEERVRGKIKKGEGPRELRLVRNPDILAELGGMKGRRTLVGFALEAEHGLENARKKLVAKNLDCIVLNAPETVGADASDFTLVFPDGSTDRYMSVTKDFLALCLVSLVTEGRLIPGS